MTSSSGGREDRVSNGSAIAIVPVRRDSQRLPGKALLAATGRPLFLHTCDRARAASSFAAVVVATDDHEVAVLARASGYQVAMTSAAPRTGSERCAEAMLELSAEFVVDVQGDWPEVEPHDLDALVGCLREGGAPIATLASQFTGTELHRSQDPNVVKVVLDYQRRAMYFSRAPIPHLRNGHSHAQLRHIGVYGFTRAALLGLGQLTSSGLAEAEGLEQLRWLENGVTIQVVRASGQPWGIETAADYEAFVARQGAPRRQPQPQDAEQRP
jgi:3-deoxy-manno-octulosonate cytidylyltransferase (CMP-KDO synthetase)